MLGVLNTRPARFVFATRIIIKIVYNWNILLCVKLKATLKHCEWI
jgi:hypothetical protein